MLYGVEIWGCMRSLEAIEHVACFPHVLWGGHVTSEVSLTMDIPTSNVGGKSEVRAVLV